VYPISRFSTRKEIIQRKKKNLNLEEKKEIMKKGNRQAFFILYSIPIWVAVSPI